MNAKRRQSPFEDLLDIAACLPWAVSVAVAILSFIGLTILAHRLQVPVPAHGVSDLGTVAVRGLYGTMAAVGRWLVSGAFLIGAAASLIGTRHRAHLFDRAADDPTNVERMSWRDFERLIGETFGREGYSVSETGGPGADGGVDLVLRRDGRETLVQCKHWRRHNVGVTIIRELHGVMAHRQAAAGIVVTGGRFTPEAVTFAQECDIRLVDGSELKAMLRGIPAEAVPTQGALLVAPAAVTASNPQCPRCGSGMVVRRARRGASAGQKFYGCSQYPKCRGTVPIPS